MAESTLNVASLLLKRKNIVDGFVTDFKSLYQSIVTDPYKNISQLTEYFSAYYKTDLPSVKSKILTQLTDIFVDLAPGYVCNINLVIKLTSQSWSKPKYDSIVSSIRKTLNKL
ncbi:hypothetical protein RF11_10626 [Thelohanellus kitauei]|uniref:Nucleolar complex-associated protein 3 N-terminal domain-containing protein n=1 Tax=Thelohanellus kitauei TaxID=669202 RepID=A0A0C2N5A9_THEKT|nr:hypothetical protein RF11_10626 [Thelohanellus kitauei]